MLKTKNLIASILLLFSTLSYADYCPTVSSLQTNNLQEWKALNINNGEPLSQPQIDFFISHVEDFVLAEWMRNAPEGESHCYYKGVNDAQSDFMSVYLAKTNLAPKRNNNFWKQIATDIWQCKKGIAECYFE